MTFIVSNFKSRVRDWLRPYTYNVVINPPVGGGRELELRTEQISLPGMSFMASEGHKPYGNGLMLTIPHSINTQEIACVHNIDGDADVIQTFYDWANLIVNVNGDEKFSANYYDVYARADMIINIFDLQGRRVKRYKLNRVYPLSYDQIQMAWESSGEVAKLNVTYRFQNFEVQ